MTSWTSSPNQKTSSFTAILESVLSMSGLRVRVKESRIGMNQ
ncbi:hypothetical protein IGK31_000411 [Enterococcus sp. DIV1288f]